MRGGGGGGDPWSTNLALYSMQLNMSIHNKYGLGVWISAILQMFDKLYIEGGGDTLMGTYLAQKAMQFNTRINIIYDLG